MTKRAYSFPELAQLEAIIETADDLIRVEVVSQVNYEDRLLPLYCIQMGSEKPEAPVLAFFGGIHGLEKIGSEILFAYLQTVISLLDWDKEFQHRLEQCRLIFFPMVNPAGIMLGTRCNGNGIDLMRNSPIKCAGERTLYSGHRLSPRLPWYQGNSEKMEIEAVTVCEVVRNYIFDSSLAFILDLHSGFGIHDRLWFPYAYSHMPFPNLAQIYAWKRLFDRSYPNHFYKIEPTSVEYLIEGDLWDYLYLEHRQKQSGKGLFLPMTLEMGSWLWLRKNPRHLFSRHGFFHPLLPHRRQRILRRHFTLFDFLLRSLLNPEAWAFMGDDQKNADQGSAMDLWYGH
jgi:Zinc carboxypeptidase